MFRARTWLFAAVMSSAATSVPAQNPTSLTDAEIAHIVYIAGQIEIEYANLALNKSSTASVRAFASATLSDHTAANKAALSSLAASNINPQDNPISQSLAGAGTEHSQQLSQLSGAAFDKAYAENELAYHVLITGALETRLIPSTQNGQVKSLLQSELALFKQHQKDATQLVSQFK
jgi:putative membrane protein